MTTSRCNDLVERHGYYTGRRCSNPATWLCDGKPVCGTHKNKRLRRWNKPNKVEPIPKEEQS